MKYAINLNPVLPVRVCFSETSEMVTQLLFGEYCEVFSEENSFVRVKNCPDGYEGWADKKMLTEISLSDIEKLKLQPKYRTIQPVTEVSCLTDNTTSRLTMGSLLPNYDNITNTFGIGDMKYRIDSKDVNNTDKVNADKENLIITAKNFLNTPYLWGGKNAFGIDCSGFVQIVFSLQGMQLPRDASMQVKEGKDILYKDALKGDLFFFGKDDKITHVGIYTGDGHIIHASGKVRIDKVNQPGIFISENLTFTHYLSAIRRIF